MKLMTSSALSWSMPDDEVPVGERYDPAYINPGGPGQNQSIVESDLVVKISVAHLTIHDLAM